MKARKRRNNDPKWRTKTRRMFHRKWGWVCPDSGRHKINCWWCRSAMLLSMTTIDHLIPLRSGGTNAEINLVPACERCNKQRNVEHQRTGRLVYDPTPATRGEEETGHDPVASDAP